MFLRVAAVLVALSFASCSSLDFYAPDVGEGWTTDRVVTSPNAVSVGGVSVQRVGEEYSPIVSVGNLVSPSYAGARKESWSVSGPNGFRATVDLIQSDLIFMGPMDKNVLQADSIDFTKGRQVILVKQAEETLTSVPGPVTAPWEVKLGTFAVTPTYEGTSGGKVSNYKSWGMTTGLRLTDGKSLMGYLSLTNGTALQKAPQTEVKPLLAALALIAAQPHFPGRTPPQKLVPEVIDVFGLKGTIVTSHN